MVDTHVERDEKKHVTVTSDGDSAVTRVCLRLNALNPSLLSTASRFPLGATCSAFSSTPSCPNIIEP
jgi:hypothetical protein